MRDALWMVVVTAVSGVLLSSCATDLGTCDESMLGGSSAMGSAKPNAGQVIVDQTCAGGRCHASTAKGKNRVGVPAGLNFDVLPTSTSMDELARVTNSAKVVHSHADSMWGEIDAGRMPPENQGRTLNAADKETLRNWLACGAPVIFAPVGVGGTDWASIYTGLTGNGCLACHGSAPAAGGGFALGMDACSAYKNVVGKAAITTVGMPPCAPTGMQLVVAGQPDMSLLLKKVEGTQTCGGAMPMGTSGLGTSNATVMALRTWIMSGAMPPPGCM